MIQVTKYADQVYPSAHSFLKTGLSCLTRYLVESLSPDIAAIPAKVLRFDVERTLRFAFRLVAEYHAISSTVMNNVVQSCTVYLLYQKGYG